MSTCPVCPNTSSERDKCGRSESTSSGFRCSILGQEVIKVNRPSIRGHKRGRPTSNAARERSRVKTLRSAFLNLQLSLPAVPPDTKLSKLDVLLLATAYITHLRSSLSTGEGETRSCIHEETGTRGRGEETPDGRHHRGTTERHPVKKWPMRTRLYDGILDSVRVSRSVDSVCVSKYMDSVRERRTSSKDRQ